MFFSMSRKEAALFFCFIAGATGLHRFYIGRWKTGLAMLAVNGVLALIAVMKQGMTPVMNVFLLLWGLCFLTAVVDFFLILFNVMKDGKGYYI